MEIFKPVIGYEGRYEVSNLGNVKSLNYARAKKEGLLKPAVNVHGYYFITLCKERKQTTKKIHQLVAEAFLGHSPCGSKVIVDHIDNVKTNNRVENLQLTTNRHNSSKDRKGGSSKYIGVCWDKHRGKWLAQITINDKNKYLGRFTEELEAAAAYIKAVNHFEVI